jgi:uncharacterized repeat protein (TIGR03806 family)
MTLEIRFLKAPSPAPGHKTVQCKGDGMAALAALLMAALPLAALAIPSAQPAGGLAPRPQSKPYLLMPERAGGALPPLLSQTGAFADVRSLTPVESLIAYDIIVPFWSDGASKSRWMAAPNDASCPMSKIEFRAAGEWRFPKGTVFVKHFDLADDQTRPLVKRRLETRLLVCDAAGGVYGVTYKWRPDNSDADLLRTNLTESIVIKTAAGTTTQTWYYPSRQDCLVCHTANAGLVLGVKTRQLNRPYSLGSELPDNQLRAWNRLGLFEPSLSQAALASCPKLAPADDPTRSLEDRARSYLDANCAHCHRPGGTVAYFDARFDTPLARQNLIQGPVLIDQGIDGARVIAPHDIWRSILYMRANSIEAIKMPPLAHNALDEQAITLLGQWIQSLPGRDVLAPPTLSPPQGNYANPIDVALKESQPGASIRYTLDGSVPTTSDPLYEKPLHLAGPTILRAKAFKPGFTRSITVQSVYIIGE